MIEIKFIKAILVVDDSPASLTAIKQVLMPVTSYHVYPAKSFADALSSLSRNAIDLMLLDIEMPGRNGFDLLEEIRKDAFYTETPAIFVTGHTSSEFITRAGNMGVTAYIAKPITADVLLKKTEKVFTEMPVSNTIYNNFLYRLGLVEAAVKKGDFSTGRTLIDRIQGEHYMTAISLILKRLITLLNNRDGQNSLKQLNELYTMIKEYQD
jgi:CheY-like chemotaxis protein